MKQSGCFGVGGALWFVVVLGLLAPLASHAQEDMWILPDFSPWAPPGSVAVGSPTEPGMMMVAFQGQLLVVPPSAVPDYLMKGGRLGWPSVVVPMLLDGKGVAVPLDQVADYLRKGAQVSDELVIMHKGDEQIAVRKSEVAEYQAKGYVLGPKQGWMEGRLMCYKGQNVVVLASAVDKYKKDGAVLGPCK
ncbi:MAG: hypothetical protein N3B01_04180 [Verrucomicrobiae bacterium]|nr:hypothetical protein [Verrucomicrobiae bacterium]